MIGPSLSAVGGGTNPVYERTYELLYSRRAVVAVVGLGHVGLPLCRALVGAGYRVLGADVDAPRVASLNAGRSCVGTVPDADVKTMLGTGRFGASARPDAVLGSADAVAVCVPTPLDGAGGPDLSCVRSALGHVAGTLRPGQLVVLESTTYPGTTRGVALPLLEGSGLRAGEDFFLAYSPEREDPGNPGFGLHNVPKLVGGIDARSAGLARLLYLGVAGSVVAVSSPEVAEAAKLLENAYRLVNIALANEFKVALDGMGPGGAPVDVNEVVSAAATKPFGFQPFHPGPGVGGHCIPVDPLYLSWAARRSGSSTPLIDAAAAVNASMPAFVFSKTASALNARGKCLNGARVLLVGAAYKPGVADARESPALPLAKLFLKERALLSYHDPLVPSLPGLGPGGGELRGVELTEWVLHRQDAVVVVTDHPGTDWGRVAAHSSLVVDARNALKNVPRGGESSHCEIINA